MPAELWERARGNSGYTGNVLVSYDELMDLYEDGRNEGFIDGLESEGYSA